MSGIHNYGGSKKSLQRAAFSIVLLKAIIYHLQVPLGAGEPLRRRCAARPAGHLTVNDTPLKISIDSPRIP